VKYFLPVFLLLISNVFMTVAWYGHLKYFGKDSAHSMTPLWMIILFSWGIAFFEYCFQVPANRLGSQEFGGPFSLLQLKIIQEVITLIVFVIFSTIVFKNTQFTTNHLIGFLLLIGSVYFIFKP
jgi:uncharacterized protein (DUF486 family)